MPSPPAAESSSGESVRSSKADDDAHDGELIRWSLSLSPEERLAVLQDFVDTFWTPRHG